ncbi:glycoside hydrolase family 55 protein [Athelia psychrophila]|uniref:Glycoside hydrolase family 55 protein n=1 Tax=Athelia psychrophila TaxID=1759441 RepID=A0A167WDI5_9AGAM|nr:glycoside hydrolase family 55 protein [Fibularhizoctonia sp. CBS 109695]
MTGRENLAANIVWDIFFVRGTKKPGGFAILTSGSPPIAKPSAPKSSSTPSSPPGSWAPIFVQSSVGSNSSLAGSLVLNNIKPNNPPAGVTGGTVVLAGYHCLLQGPIANPTKFTSLLDSSGCIFGPAHPQ